MLLLGWYNLATSDNVKSTLKQCCVYQCISIYNVGQRQINFVSLNIDINYEIMLLFSTPSFITLINVKTTLWIWPFSKSWDEQKNIFELQEKMTHLIDNTCFWLWSIKKKRENGTYNVKMNVGKYNAWYMKRIWK